MSVIAWLHQLSIVRGFGIGFLADNEELCKDRITLGIGEAATVLQKFTPPQDSLFPEKTI
jgi:hypothetical protein